MILQMLGCLYLSGWLIESVTVSIGLHKHGIKSPTYTLPAHCIAMMGAFPFIALGSIFWPFYWFERRLPEEVRQKRRREALARREERQRNKGKRK